MPYFTATFKLQRLRSQPQRSNVFVCSGYLKSESELVRYWFGIGGHFCRVFQGFPSRSEPSVGCGTFDNVRQRDPWLHSLLLSIVPPFIMCAYLVIRDSSVLTRNFLGLIICSTLLNRPKRKLDKYIPPLPRTSTEALAAVSQLRDQLHRRQLLENVERIRSNVRETERTTRENDLQASSRRRRPAVVQDENLQPGLSRYTQATQAQVRFLNSIC